MMGENKDVLLLQKPTGESVSKRWVLLAMSC